MVIRSNRTCLALALMALGCGGSVAPIEGAGAGPSHGVGGSPGSGGSSSTIEPRPDAGNSGGTGPSNDGPIVHEWGTYTSVHATDGHALGGVHHVDEALPSWVHRREFTPQSYFFEELPEEPHEQLETPVLYFHSPVARAVSVDVSFPEGIVGEWFPEATSYAPAQGSMTALGQGSMVWSIELDPTIAPASFLPVSPDEIWAPSRNASHTKSTSNTSNSQNIHQQSIDK